MNTKVVLLAAGFALATVMGGVGAAFADVYSFSFVADTSDPTDGNYGSLVITGDFFTVGSALPAVLNNIIGTVASDGTSGIESGTITGLTDWASSDNMLLAIGTSGQVDVNGISFSEGGQTFNIYDWNGPNEAVASAVDSNGYVTSGVVGTLTVTAVPELSTWAMLLLGFAGLGFAGYRGSRKTVALPT